MRCKLLVLMIVGLSLLLVRCDGDHVPKAVFTIVSGSENKSLEPILLDFGKKNGVEIRMDYMGSVDIMHELEGNEVHYDAVWPAGSLWISLGDKNRVVKHVRSIMTTPVVFGIRKSLARDLEFIGREVRVADILAAIESGRLHFAMTSATQSNSGTSAYLGFIYALLGNPEMISIKDLHKPELRSQIKKLLSGMNRSSGSSGWLKDLFLKSEYDSMVNYEAMIIEANQELTTSGREPLYAVYPIDGTVIADSPLGYVNRGDSGKEEIFKKLQEYLLSDEIQEEVLNLGRRTGFGGITGKISKDVFNPDWGIDTEKILVPIRYPAADVIIEALHLYQSELRKPSFTIFCLDFSGSMQGQGETDLKESMRMLLDQGLARQNFLQASAEDRIIVIPFNQKPLGVWSTGGSNAPEEMPRILQQVMDLSPGGGTDIYSPVIYGLSIMARENLDGFIPAIILMTDGKSNQGQSFEDLRRSWNAVSDRDIPVFSILFGDASAEQLQQISDLTRSRIFDGRKDLVRAFREAKGYN